MILPLTRMAMVASLLLWAAQLFAMVQYARTEVTFSNKSARGCTPATIEMTGGWTLASLTNAAEEAIDFRPLRINEKTLHAKDGTLFSPDQNIGTTAGPWIASFTPPSHAIIDRVELPLFLYTGCTNSEFGLLQGPTAEAVLEATLILIDGKKSTVKTKTFKVVGTNTFTSSEQNTPVFEFAPQAVTQLSLQLRRLDGASGINAGLTKLVFGCYTATPETVSFINKTATSIDLSGGWSLIERSHPFQTEGTVGGSLSILTPNANVGAGTPWSVTLAAPKARTVASVGLSIVMFNRVGGTQTASSNNRKVKFTVEALGGDGSVLGSATSEELSLTGNNTNEVGKRVTLSFAQAIDGVAQLRIIAARGEAETKGCFYGLKRLQVAGPLTLDAIVAPEEKPPQRCRIPPYIPHMH
ncbi:MAG: hypothetical protein ACI4RT_08450 [Candidatus Spyradenecus sp.]